MKKTEAKNEQIYTVSQKKLGHFLTAYNFRNIEQIFTKFGTNHVPVSYTHLTLPTILRV